MVAVEVSRESTEKRKTPGTTANRRTARSFRNLFLKRSVQTMALETRSQESGVRSQKLESVFAMLTSKSQALVSLISESRHNADS